MKPMARLAAVLLLAVACGRAAPGLPSATPPASPPRAAPIRVTAISATAGFRHDSIPVARQTLVDLGARTGAFTVAAIESPSDITPDRLASTDVLMFLLTTGELAFDATQKSAIVAFVNNGGGFIGIHSAADTLYQWSDYGRLVGAYFKEHPWTQEATVTVEDRSHPIDASLGASFRLLDEFYTFQSNPRPTVHVLLSLDAASVGLTATASSDFPLAWTQTIGRGRSYYNALGHFESTWRDASFQGQLANAIRWTAHRE